MQQGASRPSSLTPVGEGLYAYLQLDGSWGLNNPGLIVDGEHALLIDTCFTERRTRALLDAVRQKTAASIDVLANTHHHRDHVNGNYLVEAPVILAHEVCRRELDGYPTLESKWFDAEWGTLIPALPNLTFTSEAQLWVGDLNVHALHLGPAHTRGDIVFWVPDRGVLYAGDVVFAGGTPLAMEGSVTGMITALEKLRELGAEKIVPGHGPIAGPEVYDGLIRYFQWVWEVGQRNHSRGLTPLEAARRTELGEFANLLDPERLVANLYGCYGEITGQPFDSQQAYADMTELKGEPLSRLI